MDNAYVREATARPVTRSMTAAYLAQAGGSISPYVGNRYMKGNGFFGRILKSGIMPLINKVIPYLSRAAMPTVQNFAQNIADGQTLGQAGKRSLKKATSHILDDVSSSLKQDGSGIIGRNRKKAKEVLRKCNTVSSVARQGSKTGKGGKRSKKAVLKTARKSTKPTASRKVNLTKKKKTLF